MGRQGNSRFDGGQSTIEMALLLLPFLLMVLAVIEFGWYFLHQHTLQFATREGMRLALVGEQLQDSQGKLLTREASIIQTVKDYASGVMEGEHLQVWIFQVTSTYDDPHGWETQAPVAGEPGQYMRVKVRHEHRFVTELIAGFFPNKSTFPMWAEGTFRNELFDPVS
ncbi:pilus assembly protein [Candidatus Nitronereus thalassa]|uniref:Pilus assembly protein n=1 Tax=Candidatus Nitronereus thalassa TaxID=3020898 RepID=A0ABU3KAX4_9BACT|nr:pilus assembly protein [Candidatus Nitronereus thalassa]MDT7043453.1 pilus assembly protein [Candidatus Nitronereus thalassa]